MYFPGTAIGTGYSDFDRRNPMLRNATNLTNTTVLVDIFGAIYNVLSSPWIKSIVSLIVLIIGGRGVVGLVSDWRFKKTKNLNHIFSNVKIIQTKNGTMTCEYSQQDVDRWLQIRTVKIFLGNHGALRLYKKTKQAKKHYEKVDREVREELLRIATCDIWKQVTFDIVPWDDRGDAPTSYYYDYLDGENRNITS